MDSYKSQDYVKLGIGDSFQLSASSSSDGLFKKKFQGNLFCTQIKTLQNIESFTLVKFGQSFDLPICNTNMIQPDFFL